MFLVNSRLGLFTATLSRSTSKSLHATRVALLPKLRGDFAEFLSESYLAHLSILYQPTCGGLRYGYPLTLSAKLFLAVWSQHLPLRRKSLVASVYYGSADFPAYPAYATQQALPVACVSILLRPSAFQMIICQFRNINLMSIAYAFRPQLRFRLTPRGRACRGKP